MISSPMVVLDFETTGMSPEQGARITEVAALRVCNGQIQQRFVSLVNCQVPIPSFIQQLTGISQAMLKQAPLAAEVVPQLLEFIGDDPLVAHNASFDQKFLVAESALLGLQPRHSALLCTLKLSRRLLPGHSSYSLSRLATSLGLRFSGPAHRAEADAEVTSQLLLHLAQHLQHQAYASVTAELLIQLNQLSAAKVKALLKTRQIDTHQG